MDENEVVYVGVEDMNPNVEEGVVPDTRSMAVKRSGGIIIAWLLISLSTDWGLDSCIAHRSADGSHRAAKRVS